MTTVVLIHGSTQNASCWDLVRPHLEERGHQVIAPELPADQPEWTASDFARLVADQIPDDATIVAHSASGILLPIIAQIRTTRSLVYLAAMIPAPGVTPLEQLQREPDMLNPAWVQVGRNWPDHADDFLFHDVIISQREWAHSTLRPMRVDGMLREQLAVASIAPVPSLCIICGRDKTMNPDWQERAWLERGAGMLRRMDTGHCPHLASPRHVASHIDFATNSERLASVATRERDWQLRGRMAPRHWTGPVAPHTDYDAFMAVPCPDRQRLFISMTAENKAEVVRTKAARWLDENRDRLTAEQIKVMDECIASIIPRLYEQPRLEEDERRQNELIGHLYGHYTREEMAEALVMHW